MNVADVSDEQLWLLRCFAILVERCGGSVRITEEDLRNIGAQQLAYATTDDDGAYLFGSKRGSRRLFIGGPWHERMERVPGNHDVVRVMDEDRADRQHLADILHLGQPVPEAMVSYRQVLYRRVRMAHTGVKKVRSFMLLDGMPEELGQRLLNDYLGKRWIEEAPDA